METVYIETTIVSYLVAKPSANIIVAAHQELTRKWWNRQLPKFACFISEVVLNEARRGDPKQAMLRLQALEKIPTLSGSADAERLAAFFLAQVLPPRALGDAAHLAIATAGRVKYLVTWNCVHLANAQLLDRLEPVAAKAGFKLPRVCTPEELMGISTYE